MADFTYDNQDFSAIRVATVNLQRASQQATWTSLLGFSAIAGYHYLTRNNPNSRWHQPKALFGSLALALPITYVILTWNARRGLDNAAAHINTKYSNIISRTLNFEK